MAMKVFVFVQKLMLGKKSKFMFGKKSNTVAIMSLAVRVSLTHFKVKETIGNMLAELKPQSKNEYDQNECCKKDIDETKDSIHIEQRKKKDLEGKSKDSTNILATFNGEIKTLKQEVSGIDVSLKMAGIDRKAESALCKQFFTDQRATITILNIALDRMKWLYAQTFLQIKSHRPVTRAAAANPAPKPKAYEKSAGASGFLNLLQMQHFTCGRASACGALRSGW